MLFNLGKCSTKYKKKKKITNKEWHMESYQIYLAPPCRNKFKEVI